MHHQPQLRLEVASDTPTVVKPRTLLDVPALAVELGVTIRFVRRLVAERRVPFLKIGKFIRFDPAEIATWIDAQRVALD